VQGTKRQKGSMLATSRWLHYYSEPAST
jgi:hypothetical protein